MSLPLNQRLLVVVLLTAALAPNHTSAQARDTVDVLFIGNSYVYYNNLPDQVEALAAALAGGPVIRADDHVHGGMSLQGHLDDGHLPALLEGPGPDRRAWDQVILQEQSRLGAPYSDEDAGTIGDIGPFSTAARALVARIRNRGSEPVLYMTWAKEAFPHQIERLAAAYEGVGRELDAAVAPAGRAWERVRRERPDLGLFVEDGSHPNATGTYLVACVMYATLTGRSPLGAPATLQGHPMDGAGVAGSEVETLVALDAETAAYLQRVAWETVKPR